MDQKVIIITGGAGNIGKVGARTFADKGYAVAIVDVDEAEGERFAKEMRDEGKEVTFIKADITDDQAVADVVNQVVEKYGRLDVMWNNAGTLGKSRILDGMEMPEFRKVLDVNLMAAVNFTIQAARAMVKAGNGGTIIGTSSICGFLPNHEPICYPVSKGGMNLLIQAAARELGGTGIRVVGVAPGWMHGIVKGAAIHGNATNVRPDGMELHMNNRIIDPEEVANVAYFLTTPEASAINGSVIHVDDGYTKFKLQSRFYKEGME